MNLEHLTTFQWLVREKSFVGAAESLAVSQPTVTMRIREIEESVGQPLFYRLGPHVTLTEAGELFLSYVNRVTRVLERGKEAVNKELRGAALRISAMPSVTTYLLPSFLRHWYRAHSNTVIHIHSEQAEDVLHRVRDGIADAGILWGVACVPPLEAVHLYQDPICLAVSPASELAQRNRSVRSLSVKQLKDLPVIAYAAHAFEQVRQVYIRHGMIPKVVIELTHELTHVVTAKRFVQAEAGVAFLPYSTVRQEHAEGKLAIYKVAEMAELFIPVQLIYNPHDLSSGLQALIRMLMSFTEHFPDKSLLGAEVRTHEPKKVDV